MVGLEFSIPWVSLTVINPRAKVALPTALIDKVDEWIYICPARSTSNDSVTLDDCKILHG